MDSEKQLTREDLDAARRLRALWEEHNRKHRVTQEKAAEDMGWTPATVSGHLRGTMRISTQAALTWAEYLNVSVGQIRPALYDALARGGEDTGVLGIDKDLFQYVFAQVDAADKDRAKDHKPQLSPLQRAELVLEIYRVARQEGRMTEDTIRNIVRMQPS